MKLLVRVDEQQGQLEIEQEGGRWRFRLEREGLETVNGDASVVEVEPGIYSVLWNGASFEAKILWESSKGVVDVGPEHFVVEASDPREVDTTRHGSAAGSRHEVVSPMPGKVVRVLVEEGQEVTVGQGIVVVEAMKMQNEMQSAKAGRVTSVRVKAGEAVAGGEVLAVIE
ncbi:MAG: biotin/lipoyl-binding protein [Bryobacterales bacterium]|nr:biotin/lipoyl-binding protein [Bryobacterales bacterium]